MNSFTRPTYANQAREKLILSTKTHGYIKLSHQSFQNIHFIKCYLHPIDNNQLSCTRKRYKSNKTMPEKKLT